MGKNDPYHDEVSEHRHRQHEAVGYGPESDAPRRLHELVGVVRRYVGSVLWSRHPLLLRRDSNQCFGCFTGLIYALGSEARMVGQELSICTIARNLNTSPSTKYLLPRPPQWRPHPLRTFQREEILKKTRWSCTSTIQRLLNVGVSAQPLLQQQQQAGRRAHSVTRKWHNWWKRLIDTRGCCLNFMNNGWATLSVSPRCAISQRALCSVISMTPQQVDDLVSAAFQRRHKQDIEMLHTTCVYTLLFSPSLWRQRTSHFSAISPCSDFHMLSNSAWLVILRWIGPCLNASLIAALSHPRGAHERAETCSALSPCWYFCVCPLFCHINIHN